MKNTFKHYHNFTESEFQNLWKRSVFIFDTNTLLNLYRYSGETVEKYFLALGKLKSENKLWMPYQIGFEFHSNRIEVINELKNSYESILKILDKTEDEIKKKYTDHPFLDLKKIKDSISEGLQNPKKEIKKAQKKHPNRIKNDNILEKLNEIFEGIVGVEPDIKEIKDICKEGEGRYRDKTPPGFSDANKGDKKMYGDLIIRKQIIKKAKDTKKPIILITGDIKEDWRLKNEGERLMPHPLLKKGLFELAGVEFHMYTGDRFLEYYFKLNPDDKSEKTISEVRKIREIEEGKERKRFNKNKGMLSNRLLGNIQRVVSEFERAEDIMYSLEKYGFTDSKNNIFKLFRELKTLCNIIRHERINSSNLSLYEHFHSTYINYIKELSNMLELDCPPLIKHKIENYISDCDFYHRRRVNV